jgi:hypothetical protein
MPIGVLENFEGLLRAAGLIKQGGAPEGRELPLLSGLARPAFAAYLRVPRAPLHVKMCDINWIRSKIVADRRDINLR